MKRLPESYFQRVYEHEHDPWGFETRWYERRKYALTVSALRRERYARAFEPGCSLGVLSELLAQRCDTLIACEPVAAIAERARMRLAGHSHVLVEVGTIPEVWPDGELDLVVLSEVAYYLEPEGMQEVLTHLTNSLTADAHVIAVHYRGTTDYPLSGDAAHAALRSSGLLRTDARYEEADFVLELFTRAPR
jgi:Nodulation protein S (NodS)